jgi:integrase
MASLRQDNRGNYVSRKKLPMDVRDEYGRLFGQRHEAKFFQPASTERREAQRQFSEWSAEVDGNIIAIRAARDGTGLSLTPVQARRLAGEWYTWWTARHTTADKSQIEHWRNAIVEAVEDVLTIDALREAQKARTPEECKAILSAALAEADGFTREELGEQREDVREAVRPVLADIGETAQFLAAKGIALTNAARNLFLDWLWHDLGAALQWLERRAQGDYSPDKYAERFPKEAQGPDSGITPWQLFELWVKERKPAAGTVENWRYMFRALNDDFEGRSAGSIQPEEAEAWLLKRVTANTPADTRARKRTRTAETVKNTTAKAVNTVFRWGVKKKHLARNPFEHAADALTVSKRPKLRDTQAFTPEERSKILSAALAVKAFRKQDDAARRWVPWLCAYTGARAGEITQLRKADVIDRGGIHALKITPEAGTVKNAHARVVPLHEHLIAQGFLRFVREHRDGPLFYRPRPTTSAQDDPLKRKKTPAAQVRQRLAAWVRRELGVTDEELSPIHGWRHTFKAVGRSVGISDKVLDDICGHAPASEGQGYGRASLEDMAAAIRKLPRYGLRTPRLQGSRRAQGRRKPRSTHSGAHCPSRNPS